MMVPGRVIGGHDHLAGETLRVRLPDQAAWEPAAKIRSDDQGWEGPRGASWRAGCPATALNDPRDRGRPLGTGLRSCR